ncbi:phosphoadenylyl-sulfate reductase [Candidatus Sumerlaeota bacterium]|nr:phosphoadenylyl-sulfate reductase [Candidatus Sumerlaeota bacterium]
MTSITDLPFDIDQSNRELESASPEEIIRFVWETLGPDVAMQSSFGADSACLLHLATRVVPDIRVLFLETHYHFPETQDFRRALTERLGLNVVELEVLRGRDGFLAEHGDELHQRDRELCCHLNKVEPMEEAKRRLGLRAYLTGIRRGQSETRQHFQILTPEPTGVIKVAPILTWSKEQVREHIRRHDLPFHPLVAAGYPSIGCWPCTVKPIDPTDERSGRWLGSEKTECGLHLPPPSEK